MRVLVQVDPAKIEQVRSALSVAWISVISQAFNYITIDIPQELVPKIKAIPGVIAVIPEKRYEIKRIALPVEKKLVEFQRLFFSNPLTGPPLALAYSIKADTEKKRVPTSESRKMVGADVAEAEGITGKGIKVAVLDTGTDPTCSQGSYWGGKSSMEGQPVQWDENGHGTHVETTISGKLFSSINGLLKGVAVDAEVVAFKCLGGLIGFGTTSAILAAFENAAKWGADIFSLSLGGDDEDYTTSPYHAVISNLTKQGKICVIAAGNSGPDPNTIGSPGSCPDALTVGAVSYPDGTLAEFSSLGPTLNGLIKPDCVAPGVDILSSTATASMIAAMQFMDGPRLACISGTSMATPHVAGLCALALQYARMKGKKLTTDHIKEALDLYGEYAGAKNNSFGWGLITFQLLKNYIDGMA